MGPPDSHRISRVPRYSGYHDASARFGHGAVTRYGHTFQYVILTRFLRHRGPTTPSLHCYSGGLGSSPFARHYLGNHYYFLFLRVLRCFSSPRSPHNYCRDDRSSTCRVFPFGDPRINGYLHLTAAFRSLSRPSSPVRA